MALAASLPSARMLGARVLGAQVLGAQVLGVLVTVLLALGAINMSPAAAQSSGGARLALVIGNSAYQHTQALPNPRNDAEDMARALEAIGFTVTFAQDLGRAAMNRVVREFGERANGAAVALMFYAGHGMQLSRGVSGENYLVPIDARLADIRDVDEETLSLTRVLERLDGAISRIVILDACRDNPLAAQMRGQTATRSAARGLARAEAAERGTLLAFSTEPGNVALDGQGRNSPFAGALLEHLPTPGLDVRLVLTRVRAAVVTATQGRQTPWSNDGLMQEVVLRTTPMPPAAPGGPVPVGIAGLVAPEALAAELAFWSSVQNATDPRELEAYIEAYPNGRFLALARARLERLRAAAQTSVVIPAVVPGAAPPTPAPAPVTRVIARPGLVGYSSDSRGCQLWNQSPRADETVLWSGACRNGLAEGAGSGEWRWRDGVARFSGTLIAGRLHGAGRFEWPGGERYEGHFAEGSRTGRGVYVWGNGERYEGTFLDGLPHGEGVLTLANRDRYEGAFQRGARSGAGRLMLANGDRYEGEFHDGERTGRGIYAWINGDRFEGEFVNGLPAGRGVFVPASGGRYEGTFTDGRRTGQGVFTWPGEDRYEGAFLAGARTGRGIYTWRGGDRYEGEFLDGVLHGAGAYVFANGNRFEGQFHQGRAHGPATLSEQGGARLAVEARDGCVRWGAGHIMAFGRPAENCATR